MKQNNNIRHLVFAIGAIHAILITAYAGFIGTGMWHFDEYETFFQYKIIGFDFLWLRISTWSPRPFSEILIYLYALATNATQNQLIIIILSAIWIALIASVIIPAAKLKNSSQNFSFRILPLLLPLTLTLSGTKTGEVFYWPMGSLAYMPFISSLLVMLGILIWSEPTKNKIAWGLSGVLMAASVEMGAFFILFLTLFYILCIFIFPKNNDEYNASIETLKSTAPATAMALAVLVFLALGRFGNTMEAQIAPTTSHNIFFALKSAFTESTLQIIGKTTNSPSQLISYFIVKTCFGIFIFSIFSILPLEKNRKFALVTFGTACIGTIVLSTFAAYYQFGTSCCERHETIRHFLSYIFIAVIAISLTQIDKITKPLKSYFFIAASASGIIFSTASAFQSYKKFKIDFQNYSTIVELKKTNWLFDQNNSYTFLTKAAQGQIYGDLHMPSAGFFDKDDKDLPNFNHSILKYFNVSQINFVTEKASWRTIKPNKSQNKLIESSNYIPMNCTIDIIKEIESTSSKHIENTMDIHVAGWINLPDIKLQEDNTIVLLRIKNDEINSEEFYQLTLFNRPDVVQHLNRNDLLKSGYRATVRVSKKSNLKFDLFAIEDDRVASCQLPTP